VQVNCSDAAQGGLITTWPLPEGFGGASGRLEGPAAAARGELQGMRQSALRRRAKAAGATEDDLDAADDEDDTKAALVELVLRLSL
jgi:hypothetical protein